MFSLLLLALLLIEMVFLSRKTFNLHFPRCESVTSPKSFTYNWAFLGFNLYCIVLYCMITTFCGQMVFTNDLLSGAMFFCTGIVALRTQEKRQ